LATSHWCKKADLTKADLMKADGAEADRGSPYGLLKCDERPDSALRTNINKSDESLKRIEAKTPAV
jgi:hypothetical protein